jgi:hypothetical protein
MRRLRAVVVLTGVHFALSLGLLFSAFGATMGRFDDGREASAWERVVGVASDVLLFPIVNGLADLVFRGPHELGTVVQYLLFVANSLLWAATILAIWSIWKRWRLAGAAHQRQ